MLTLGSSLKYYFFVVVVLCAYSLSGVLQAWSNNSKSELGTVLTVNNYTEGLTCSGYKQCLYLVCQVSKTAYANTVAITIPRDARCHSSSFIATEPIIYAYFFFLCATVLLSSGTVIVVVSKDVRGTLEHRPKESTLRLLRVVTCSVYLLYLVSVGMEIYYRARSATEWGDPLAIAAKLFFMLSVLVSAFASGHAAYVGIKAINNLLDPLSAAWEVADSE